MLGNGTVISVNQHAAESPQVSLRLPALVLFGEVIGNLLIHDFQMVRPLFSAGPRHNGFGTDIVQKGDVRDDVQVAEVLYGDETPDHVLPHYPLLEIKPVLPQEIPF